MTPDAAFVDSIARSLAQRNRTDAILEVAGLCLALSRRVEQLEAREVPKYVGVWHDNGIYKPNTMVTHDGSLFFCKAETTDRPGRSEAWQLCVKRGRDGRDLRA